MLGGGGVVDTLDTLTTNNVTVLTSVANGGEALQAVDDWVIGRFNLKAWFVWIKTAHWQLQILIEWNKKQSGDWKQFIFHFLINVYVNLWNGTGEVLSMSLYFCLPSITLVFSLETITEQCKWMYIYGCRKRKSAVSWEVLLWFPSTLQQHYQTWSYWYSAY